MPIAKQIEFVMAPFEAEQVTSLLHHTNSGRSLIILRGEEFWQFGLAALMKRVDFLTKHAIYRRGVNRVPAHKCLVTDVGATELGSSGWEGHIELLLMCRVSLRLVKHVRVCVNYWTFAQYHMLKLNHAEYKCQA